MHPLDTTINSFTKIASWHLSTDVHSSCFFGFATSWDVVSSYVFFLYNQPWRMRSILEGKRAYRKVQQSKLIKYFENNSTKGRTWIITIKHIKYRWKYVEYNPFGHIASSCTHHRLVLCCSFTLYTALLCAEICTYVFRADGVAFRSFRLRMSLLCSTATHLI